MRSALTDESALAAAPSVDPSSTGQSPSALEDILKRRGVRRVVYFHCDHFEPWHRPMGRDVDEDDVFDVLNFADYSAANEYSRRLTLFYKAFIGFTSNPKARGAVAATPDDPFVFLTRGPRIEETCRRAMTGLSECVDHEFQVHMHHENYTFNTSHADPATLEAFDRADAHERDAARFEFALRLGLDAIRRETGRPLDRWFFVHGMWALNASDPGVCHITNEIEILRRNGCLGDFTFPAGRTGVDPLIEAPHFVRPVDAPAGYRLPAAEPELAFGNAEAAKSKFFIWASEIRHRGTSLDYFSEHVARDLADPASFAARVLETSYVADGTLYFKTHAHSMHIKYTRDTPAPMFPHQHPGARAMMSMLFDAADRAGAAVAFLTASEVYDEFARLRPPPPGGFALTAPTNPLTAGGMTPVLSEPAAPPPFVEAINAIASAIILESPVDASQRERGVGAYYIARAERTEVLSPYEVDVTRALLAEPPFEAIYEIGSGVSVLSMCLALNGAHAVGIERDSARAAAGQAMLQRLALAHPELSARCEIRCASAPAALRGIDGRDAAIVFTNIAGSISPADLREVIDQAAAFRLAVADLSHFFEHRGKPEQAVLLGRLVDAGWGAPSQMPDPRDTYWIFRK